MADLDWLRARGLDQSILASRRQARLVFGICGGYQMLGEALLDPDGVESPRTKTTGLGLLPTSDTSLSRKSTHQVRGRVGNANGMLSHCQGAEITAYEIHMGSTSVEGLSHPVVLTSRSGREVNISDGALDYEGITLGTYLHGLFHNRAVRRSILEFAAARKGVTLPPAGEDLDPSAEYDKPAALVRERLDIELV